MRKISEKQQRKVTDGLGWYVYCNCSCISANVCKNPQAIIQQLKYTEHQQEK